MPNDSSSSFFGSFTPQQVMAVLTVVSSAVLLQLQPLQSRREVEPASSASAVGDDHKFTASPIEDPLAAVAKQNVVPPDVAEFKPKEQVKAFTHWGFYVEELLKAVQAATPERPVQVVCALLRPGADLLSCEQRHRARLAVVSGLATLGYVPESPRRMEVCRLLDVTKKHPSRFAATWRLGKREVDVPYEWFEPTESLPAVTFKKVPSPRFSRICVLWLDTEAVLGQVNDPHPIDRLRAILHALLTGYPRPITASSADYDHRRVETAILGPHDSSMLTLMLNEARKAPPAPVLKAQRWQEPLWMVSPYATSSTAALMRAMDDPPLASKNGEGPNLEQQIDRWMTQLLQGLVLGDENRERDMAERLFLRISLTDDHVARALVAELKLRGVLFPPFDEKNPCGQNDPDSGDIVLISEFDTSYGRELPRSLLEAAEVRDGMSAFQQTGGRDGRWHWTSFTRGLDGRFGAVPAAGTKKKDDEDGKKNPSAVRDEPRGTNQMDALRGLAAQIEELHRSRQRHGKRGVVAVGMLGGDVYDKLLVFRALRPVLKNTLFFTNNLDSWLWDSDELRTTRNLVVASPFDLRLGDRWQAWKPPFRDTYQTAVYAATLTLVAGRQATELRSLFTPRPPDARLFEIGRHGPVPLTSADGEGLASTLHPQHPHDLSIFATSKARKVLVWMLVLLGACFVIWLLASNHFLRHWLGSSRRGFKVAPDQGLNTPGSVTQGPDWRFWFRKDVIVGFLTHPAWPFVASAAVAVAGYHLWENQRVGGEPVSITNGTSSWFFFGVSFMAVLLALHLSMKSLAILWKGEEDLRQTYFQGLAELPRMSCGSPAGLLLAWPQNDITSVSPQGERLLHPEPLWLAFRQSGQFGPRIARATFNTAVIWTGLQIVSHLEPLDFMPVRGAVAREMCWWARELSACGFVWLSMLVFDSLWLNRIFIDWFGKGVTRWEPEKLRIKQEVAPGASFNHLCDYTDLRLIADWTRDIGRLTALPFYVLALLVLARLNYFDIWSWPWSMCLALGLAACLVILGSYTVHLAAMRLRQHTLAQLAAEHRSLDDKDDINQLMSKVQQLSHGAFTPFFKQPVMEALYWFLSAVGVTGMWQALAQMLA